MGRLIAAAGVLSFLFATHVQAAPAVPADFRYCADVDGSVAADKLYGLHISGDVLAKCSAGCGDLRLFGPEGAETPFVVIENIVPAEPQEKYQLEVTGYTASGDRAVVTLRLPEKHRAVSVLEVQTPDRDFNKRAVLEASGDGKTWRKVVEDAIYDFSSRVALRKTRLEFKKTSNRHFRLTLIDGGNGASSGRTVRLRYEGLDFSVEGMATKEISVNAVHAMTALSRESVPVYDVKTFTDLSAKTDKDGNTVVVLSAGLPVDRISFAVANPYYSRSVALYAGERDDDEAYRFVERGTIYRFLLDGRKEERLFIDARVPKRQYLKIVIENRGNPPLDVRSVALSWVQQNLYFIALRSGERHRLCFGSSETARPEYDLGRFITKENLSQHSPISLRTGDIRENPSYAPKAPKRTQERIEKLILTSVVIVVVLLLASWLYGLIKKIPDEKRG
jgi:hypothetical protein